MSATLTLQSIQVATGSSDEEGMLVLAAGRLIAVLVRLSADHRESKLQDRWFLEVGFGNLGAGLTPTFADLDEARAWIARRLPADLMLSSP